MDSKEEVALILKEYNKAYVTDFNVHLVNEIYKSEDLAFICNNGDVDLVEYDKR